MLFGFEWANTYIVTHDYQPHDSFIAFRSMNGVVKPVVKRKSFFKPKEYKPPERVPHTQAKMDWSPPPEAWTPQRYFGMQNQHREPPPEPTGPHCPKPPEDFPAKLSLKLEAEDRDTDLARICSDALHELPQLAKVGEKFSVEGSDLKLDKGESLLLLFIAELPRVHAVDTSNGSEVWLPVHAEQLYERLPIDPRLDDKLYTGVTALMNSKPLPSVVRVLEGYGSDDYSECVDQEDIIQISHIEEKDRRHGKERVLIAKNQIGHRLALHKDMDCAHFTTMMSALFLHMSELIELEFPQRVRVVEETNFEKRKPKEEKVFKLLSFKKDLQVIATRAKKPGLLSIPLSVPLALSIISFKDKSVHSCLPPLFPNINLTWGVMEFGRLQLPKSLSEICQPLPEPLRGWLESFEGKERVCKVAKVSKEDLVRDLKELTNYNKDLTSRISFLDQVDRPLIPTRDKPVAPPRPQKPQTLKLPPKPPTLVPKPHPKPRSTPASEAEAKEIPKYEPRGKSRKDSDDYEIPAVSMGGEEDDDDYEVVPDTTGTTKAGTDTACQELKIILQQKEKTITKLRDENERLTEKCKALEEERERIQQSNYRNIDEINRLQVQIDRLLSKDDDEIYDTISPTERPLPNLPISPGAAIYNSPGDLMVETKLMSRTDVEGVADILRQLNLGQYVEKFKQEEVQGELLVELEEDILTEDLGMTRLHARKLLMYIKKNVK
ncbi:uncharacterized protein LOC110987163 [Acanthaster planci]|uniref:Uncharacterized protein LOC110987163 n=1 Tax=Acanthaster planci TaxID=133434 RepID=A0A8B7ZPJ7_ACAPL|nr:uncharacterized protein LOC110987163 [Acanthaster planci]